MDKCRVCLNNGALTNIFEPYSEYLVANLSYFTELEVREDDAFSKFICHMCSQELDVSVSFKIKCLENSRKVLDANSLCKNSVKYLEIQGESSTSVSKSQTLLDQESEEPFCEEEAALLNHLYARYEVDQSSGLSPDEVLALNSDKITVLEMDPGLNATENVPNIQVVDLSEETASKDGDCGQADKMNGVLKSDGTWGEQIAIVEILGEEEDKEELALKKRAIEQEESELEAVYNNTCYKCDFTFDSQRAMTLHFRMTHPAEYLKLPFKTSGLRPKGPCRVCGKTFATLSNMRRHLLLHRLSVQEYQCHRCGALFRSNNSLDQHVQRHDRVKRLKCRKCDQVFDSQSAFNRHFKARHVFKHKMALYVAGVKNKCPVCRKTVRTRSDLSYHLEAHSVDTSGECPMCGKLFRNLEKHTSRMHCDGGRSSANKKRRVSYPEKYRRQCETCGKICIGQFSLMEHMRVHTNERPHQCPQCTMKFKYVSNLKRHEETHTKVKKFVCERCGKAFLAAGNLKIHERVHTGVRPIKCTLCSKTFNRQMEHKTHLRTHQAELLTTQAVDVDSFFNLD